jgi:hypothetical protein
MNRTALDVLIDHHHVYNVFSYRQLQLKLRILRDQSHYTVFTKLNRRKEQLRSAAIDLLDHGTQAQSEIERQYAIQHEVKCERQSDFDTFNTQELEEKAIAHGKLLPDWRDPQFDELGLRVHQLSLQKAYDLPDWLRLHDNDPVMAQGGYDGERPEVYTDQDLHLVHLTDHIHYASDLLTDQDSVSQVLNESESPNFSIHWYASEWALDWENPVMGQD